MSPKDLLLGLVVVAVWGVNFVFVRLGLDGFPPLFLCALRFFLAAVPAVFFVPRPQGSWAELLVFGTVMFGLQFALLFSGMTLGMPAGLASLLMQVQVFSTMIVGFWLLRERPTPYNVAGALISFVGISIVAAHAQGDVRLAGVCLTVAASIALGAGNVLAKRVRAKHPISWVVWGSGVAFPTLLVVSLGVEGPERILSALSRVFAPGASWSLLAVGYIVYFSTYLGYTLWGYLLSRYPAATVAPLGLLVPVFAFWASVVFLGESLPAWKIWASAWVVSGLCLSLFGARVRRRLMAVFS